MVQYSYTCGEPQYDKSSLMRHEGVKEVRHARGSQNWLIG